MTQDQTIQRALRILDERMREAPALTSPEAVATTCDCCCTTAARSLRVRVPRQSASGHRVRRAVPRHLAQTSVYPREVVKAALAHNAAAVIFAHNHPSGIAEPSRARRVANPDRSSRRWRWSTSARSTTSLSQALLRSPLPSAA